MQDIRLPVLGGGPGCGGYSHHSTIIFRVYSSSLAARTRSSASTVDEIHKCFTTGASLVDNTGGVNIAVNMSFEKDVAWLCGLTRADITTLKQRPQNTSPS